MGFWDGWGAAGIYRVFLPFLKMGFLICGCLLLDWAMFGRVGVLFLKEGDFEKGFQVDSWQ